MESREEEDGLLVEGEHRPLPGWDGERLLQTTAAPSPCALAGLQESLTSHRMGSVTGWGRSRRRGRRRQAGMGWRAGLSGGCDRPGTCLPASARAPTGGLLIGEARREITANLRRLHSELSETLTPLIRGSSVPSACHPPPTSRVWLWAFVFGLFILFFFLRKKGRWKAACNWALEGYRLSEEEAVISISVFHRVRKGALALSQGPPWSPETAPQME